MLRLVAATEPLTPLAEGRSRARPAAPTWWVSHLRVLGSSVSGSPFAHVALGVFLGLTQSTAR